MKNLKYIIYCISILFFTIGCEDTSEKFSGSPEGNLSIETITGVISTNTVFALPGQEIDFTVTLPQSFRDEVPGLVTVQAGTFSLGGGTRVGKVELLPGQNTGTGKILLPGGGGTFYMDVDLKITAITLENVIPGKHFLINSNSISIPSGSSGIPRNNDKRLQFSLDWENSATPTNRLKMSIERDGLLTLLLSGGGSGAAIGGNININGIADFPISFNGSLTTTATNFFNDRRLSIINNLALGITDVIRVGTNIHFIHNPNNVPVITFNRTSTAPTNRTFNALSTSMMSIGLNGDQPRTFFMNNIVQPNTPEFSGTFANIASYAALPNNYRLKIGVIDPQDLLVSPTNLKFRLSIRRPNGEVLVYNGIYDNLSIASGFKTIFSFKKTGIGDTSDYNNFQFIPNP